MNIRREFINAVKNMQTALYIYDKYKENKSCFSGSRKTYIRKRYKELTGYTLSLENPQRFTEKLQWIKINCLYENVSIYADKLKVREVVKELIGDSYLNKLISVYEDVDDINLDQLPAKFVLKGTHGSGYNFICHNVADIDWDTQKLKMKRWLWQNYYKRSGEWVYHNIQPRIICEEFLSEDDESKSLVDYKFFCFHGEAKYCQVIRSRGKDETIDFYDMEWNSQEFNGLRDLPRSEISHTKPEKYEEMIGLANKLSKGFPFVRIDFYYVQNRIFFGEFTFFPLGGLGKFNPDRYDYVLGGFLDLSRIEEKVRINE